MSQGGQEISLTSQDWERTFDAVPDLIAIIDNNMRIVRANKAMAERLGVKPEQCVGRFCYACVHGTEEPPSFCPHLQLLKDGQEHTAEIREDRLGGVLLVSVSPIHDAEGKLVGCVHVARDITERKRAEQALADSEQRFRQLVETSSDLIWELDRNSVITYVSPRVVDLLGYAPAEVTGRAIFEFMSPEEANRMRGLVEKILRTGRAISQLEHTYLHKDGHAVIMESSGTPILDGEGRLTGYRGIDRDISDRKRAEEALRIRSRVIAAAVNPIAMTDLADNLIYANPAFLKTWGFASMGEVAGRPAGEFWQLASDAKALLRDKGQWQGVVSGMARDGLPLELELSATFVRDEPGRPLCLAFSFADRTEVRDLRRRLKEEHSYAGIIGSDERMLDLFDTIREVARVDVSVLIQGESGTGKELAAAAIHAASARADKPFVPVNCAALPEGILESELFGHVQGAFTGAIRDRKGRFELADRGTIFLDEIGDIPPAMQVKLLRVLQDGTFQRVGGEKTIRVDVRVISATNKDLRNEIAAGRFRKDLFYRLAVVPISMPPLRERRTDIPLVAEHLLRKSLAGTPNREVIFSDEALAALLDYDWPGNVRELENAIQYALVRCRDRVLEVAHLPPSVRRAQEGPGYGGLRCGKRKVELLAVTSELERAGGRKTEAARRLGISRATLYRILGDGHARE